MRNELAMLCFMAGSRDANDNMEAPRSCTFNQRRHLRWISPLTASQRGALG